MIASIWIAYVALIGVTLTAAVTDLRTGLVPNRLTVPAVLGALMFWPIAGLIVGEPYTAWGLGKLALTGMLSGLVPYAILVLTAGLGGGDMKLMAAVGAISASWEVVLSTTVYALIVALGMAVVVMVRRGVVKQTLARVFSAALLASHRVKAEFPKDGPTVAFAAAVAVGAALAGAEQMLGLETPWRSFGP
ncbi:MAG: A24 family peptidase [Planctomycetota bacterium]